MENSTNKNDNNDVVAYTLSTSTNNITINHNPNIHCTTISINKKIIYIHPPFKKLTSLKTMLQKYRFYAPLFIIYHQHERLIINYYDASFLY